MTPTRKATVTTEHGNIMTVDLHSHVTNELWCASPADDGTVPSVELIAERLDGRKFGSSIELNDAIADLVENDPTVYVDAIAGPICVICGEIEETCDCILIGQNAEEARAAIAERMGGATDEQADHMIGLLRSDGYIARNDLGLWFLAGVIPSGSFAE
jgi:hypothetical protein